jgi:hypothetical protein
MKLLSELDKDMAAFDMIRNIDKTLVAKDSDLKKNTEKPLLMAFTMKHRIVNTVAFKAYRSLFITLQSK